MVLCVKHPVFVLPTMKASKRCIVICHELFGNTHHLHNPANAFRHALWNVLIVQYCAQKKRNINRVFAWTKQITDWHEVFSVNHPLHRAMDMHNNEIGRMLIKGHLAEKEEKLIEMVQNAAKKAQKVINIEEIDHSEDQLVYLKV